MEFSRASNSSIIRVSIEVRQLARDDDDRAGAGHDGLLGRARRRQALAERHSRLKSWQRGFKPGLRPRMTGALATRSRNLLRGRTASLSRRSGLALLLGSLAATAPLAAQDTTQRTVGASGLPLPRYASLAASQVNVRTGPSTDHPIRWVYERSGLPVRIVEESDVWRRIEDPDGETGWAHASLLSMLRTVIVTRPGRAGIASDGRHRRPRGGTAGAWGHRHAGRLRPRLVPDRGRGRARLAAARRAMGRVGGGLG